MEKAAGTIKTAIKNFCLTILGLASIFSVIILSIPAFSSKTAISMYKNANLSAAAIGVCERQYQKSNKIEDLYNLVHVCDEVGNSEKLIKYSSELLERQDFSAFEQSFNEYALKRADKDKLYLVASLKNYLCEIRIKYEYDESSEKAFLDAILCFEENDANVFYFAKYINCILAQNRSLELKKQLLSQTAMATVNEKTILTLVKERYNNIMPDGALDDADLLRLEQLWQTKSVEIVLLEATESAELETAREELAFLATIIEAKINND